MSSNNGNHDSKELLNADTELLKSLGGEALEGSGFEGEIPESDKEWEDPR